MVFGIVLALSVSLFSQTPSAQTADTWPPPGVHLYNEHGLTPPRLLHDVKPQYTSEAMKAGIEGAVELEAVVDVNGHVSAIHIAKSLDELHGVDEQVMRALEKWQFSPGFKDGESLPVLITYRAAFTLRH